VGNAILEPKREDADLRPAFLRVDAGTLTIHPSAKSRADRVSRSFESFGNACSGEKTQKTTMQRAPSEGQVQKCFPGIVYWNGVCKNLAKLIVTVRAA